MNEIKDKDKKVSFLESEEADMSIFCRIRKSVEKLLYYILLLIVGKFMARHTLLYSCVEVLTRQCESDVGCFSSN